MKGNVMGIIIANNAGILMFILGMVFAAFSTEFFDLHVGYALLTMGAGWLLSDGLLRLRGRHQPRWYIHPRVGGHFFYIPLWILGVVVIAAMLYGLAANPPGWFTPIITPTPASP